MIDSHCHFDFTEFDKDRENVWRMAREQGVEALLLPATEFKGFEKIRHLARLEPRFFYGLGLHPWFLNHNSLTRLPDLKKHVEQNLKDPQFVAIGETGLDFAIDVPVEIQEQSFTYHLELARQFSLPVIIHHRKSHNRLIQILKQFPDVRGVIHAFSGSFHEAKTYTEMGFMLGIGGTITYQRAQKTKQAIQKLSLDHLLLETDAPAMPMFGKQGERNSPEYLPKVLTELAQVSGVMPVEIDKITTANFYRLFQRADH